MAKRQLTYKKATNELEDILIEIESNNLEIDVLSLKIKRASELINFCKSKLKDTENDINKIVDNLSE